MAIGSVADTSSKLGDVVQRVNSMLERNPDYKTVLVEMFPSLKELDSVPMTDAYK